MYYRTILTLTDLSVVGDQAVQRAALMAAKCKAKLRLMYAPLSGNPRCLNHEVLLAELAREVAGPTGLSVKVTAGGDASVEGIAAEANRADLLVASYRRERDVATFFRGDWHQRVMRLSRCPVLLTRSNGQLPYAKILVAVDFSASARRVVQLACQLDDQAEIELFHAIAKTQESRLRSAEVSWPVVRAFRDKEEAYARQRLHKLALSIDMGRRTPTVSTRRGDAGRQTRWQQQNSNSSLIVVGKRRRSAMLEFFCGAISNSIVAASCADVLIVPSEPPRVHRYAAKLGVAAWK